jgi:hypothetical protein
MKVRKRGIFLLLFYGNLQGFLYLKMSENIKDRYEGMNARSETRNHKTLVPMYVKGNMKEIMKTYEIINISMIYNS